MIAWAQKSTKTHSTIFLFCDLLANTARLLSSCAHLHIWQDKTAKKINFDTFVEAVTLISEKIGKSTDDVITIIVSAKGPT